MLLCCLVHNSSSHLIVIIIAPSHDAHIYLWLQCRCTVADFTFHACQLIVSHASMHHTDYARFACHRIFFLLSFFLTLCWSLSVSLSFPASEILFKIIYIPFVGILLLLLLAWWHQKWKKLKEMWSMYEENNDDDVYTYCVCDYRDMTFYIITKCLCTQTTNQRGAGRGILIIIYCKNKEAKYRASICCGVCYNFISLQIEREKIIEHNKFFVWGTSLLFFYFILSHIQHITVHLKIK